MIVERTYGVELEMNADSKSKDGGTGQYSPRDMRFRAVGKEHEGESLHFRLRNYATGVQIPGHCKGHLL